MEPAAPFTGAVCVDCGALMAVSDLGYLRCEPCRVKEAAEWAKAHPITTECAWCLAELGRAPNPNASHGMCAYHYQRFLAELPTDSPFLAAPVGDGMNSDHGKPLIAKG